ncbi:MAG: hypothetical protein ACE5Q6_24205 [Dehalococcoidia bacterium]
MFIGSDTKESGPTFIRGVALLPGETIDHVFSPGLGLTQDSTADGQLLVATNQRVVAFCRNEGRDETFLFPVAELQGVAVKGRSRSVALIVQGILLVAGGIFLYLAVAYWMAGRFDGPSIPLINMDIGPLLVLLLMLAGGVMIGRFYFTKADGLVTFQGNNWSFTFPYRGERAGREIYQLVNSVFARRFSKNGHLFLWED